MPDRLLDHARKIAGWETQHSSVLAPLRHLGIPEDEVPEALDWNAVPLASYLQGPPASYFFEPSFAEYSSFLRERYASDLSVLVSDLAACGQDVWAAVAEAEHLATEIASTDLRSIDDYERVTHYLNPWYLRLVEQVWDSLVTLPAFRLQADVGKRVSNRPIGVFEAIRRHGWVWAGSFYNPVVRRGIAHDVRFDNPGLFAPIEVEYHDDRGNLEKLPAVEVRDLVHGMADECLAYAFSLRLLLMEYRDDPALAGVLDPNTHPLEGRASQFKRVSGSRFLRVDAVHSELVNGERQIRLECDDSTTNETERIAELLSVLASAAAWFPEGETFFVGAKGKRRLHSALRISGPDLHSWVSGNLPDQELFARFDPYLLWPLNKPLGALRANLRRSGAAGARGAREVWRKQLADAGLRVPEGLWFITLGDISTGLVRRYRCEIGVSLTSQEDVKSVIPRLVAHVRGRRVYGSRELRRRWGGTRPQYITGFLYSRQKRPRDRWADPEAQYYVGRFEWRDQKIDPEQLPMPLDGPYVEALDDDVRYEPNRKWPPPSLHVPRP